MLEQARAYLAAGLRPVPVRLKDKMPSLASWREYQLRAPTDDELVRWFGGDSKVNIGSIIPPGWIVLDFDGGKDAEKLLNEAGVFVPEDAIRVQSGSGGYHVWLKLPDGVKDFSKLAGAGGGLCCALDDKGEPCKPFVECLTFKNFAVLPPSIHPNGKEYKLVVGEWENPTTVWPELAALIDSKRTVKKPAGDKKSERGNEPGWVEELSKGVGEGGRDDAMTKLAGFYLGRRLSVAQVIDILESGFAKRCTPPVMRADIERVVRSIFKAETRKTEIAEDEFTLLGYDLDGYYYLPRSTGLLTRLASHEHNRNGLLRIAPIRYWDEHFSGKGGVSWSWAQEALMDAQHHVGKYNPERLRGRGAWWDERNGAVLHTGEQLIVGGSTIPVKSAPRGLYIYELGLPLGITLDAPLPVKEATKLMRIFEQLPWENGEHEARLALGWCVCAVVCGALNWRPHVWLTGPSGSGKSYVADSIIKRLLGRMALVVLGNTTEAGLRQTLGSDALSVVFDEAEAEDKRGPDRIQAVLGLMRQASSDVGGSIVKGGTDGTARQFKIRSCFMLSSINVSAYQTADRNRITLLNLKVDPSLTQDQRTEKFASLCARVEALFTDEFTSAFRSRCVAMIPVIRANAHTLAVVTAGKVGNRRLGDQIGALLAGAAALLSDDPLTPEEAAELIDAQDLTEQREAANSSDEQNLFDMLMQHVIKVRVSYGAEERSVANLIAASRGQASNVNMVDALDALGLIGIRPMEEGIAVCSTHSAIHKILLNTPWVYGWGRTLMRIENSKRKAVRISGRTYKCVVVPWEYLE